MRPKERLPHNSTSALHLQRIATIYSRLAPLFASLRKNPALAGNTLLPNALSPIAPAMAYGHCGELDHGSARKFLEDNKHWRQSAVEIKAEYENYKNCSGNALLWAGWNYWDPSKDGEFDGRFIQLVISDDLLSVDEDVFDASRRILGDNSISFEVSDFLAHPIPEKPWEVYFGDNPSNDLALIPDELLPPRLFFYNLWNDIFVPSVKEFREMDLDTIVDYMLREHNHYLAQHQTSPQSDFGVLFPSSEIDSKKNVSNHEGLRTFRCASQYTDILWNETLSEMSRLRTGRRRMTDRQLLVDSWKSLAKSTDFLRGGISPALTALKSILGPQAQAEREAYVILQHLALFDKFLQSQCQYVFPISFGQHVFVAFIAMRQPLTLPDVGGWRQIVSALFGSLLVELLTDLYAEERLHHAMLRKSEEQRLMLTHSLPKSVFKPAEYFAVKIHSSARRLVSRGVEVATLLEDGKGKDLSALEQTAEVLLLLLQRGQAELRDYAEGQNHRESRAAVNLYSVCEEVSYHAESLKQFFVAGYIDRFVERDKKKIRINAIERTEITAHLEEGFRHPIVRANRGLLLLHVWNLIDNAFRFARLDESGLLLDLRVLEVSEGVCLRVTNTGTPIHDDVADIINEILSANTKGFSESAFRLPLTDRGHKGFYQDMEGENKGIGIIRFSDYLEQLWDEAGKAEACRGRVEAIATGTQFEFYFPAMRG